MTAHPSLPVSPDSVYRYVGAVLCRLFPTSTREDRDDIKQEVLLRLLTLQETVRTPLPYAAQMAHNLMIDERRTEAARRRAEQALTLMGRRTVWAAADTRLELEQTLALLEQAPEQHREILRRLVLEGDPIEELIEAELAERGQDRRDPVAWAQARDTIYKRRLRAFQWMARGESA